MKNTICLILILFAFGCSQKIGYKLYVSKSGNENSELYLFENNKFLYNTNTTEKFGPSHLASSLGKYQFDKEASLYLNTKEGEIKNHSVVEENNHNIFYSISLEGSGGTSYYNESLKIVINKADTFLWKAQNRIKFDSISPYVKTIQLIYPQVKFKTPEYLLKDVKNNVIRFKCTVPDYVFSNNPNYIIFDGFKLNKNDSGFKATEIPLTRFAAPDFKLWSSGKIKLNQVKANFDKLSREDKSYLSAEK